MDAELISQLVEGENLFDSRGYSVVKVTKEGEEKFLKIPIKSTGVAEFERQLAGTAPRPPVKHEVIKADSPEGQLLGLKKDALRAVFDAADEKYVDALDRHNREFTWKVAVFGIDVEWKRRDGALVTDLEEKKAILQANGISSHQINRIFKDLRNLTRLREDQEDFLPES
jgi:hypothetical protein